MHALRKQLALDDVHILRVLSSALDISDPEQFYCKMIFAVAVPDNFSNPEKLPFYTKSTPPFKKKIQSSQNPLVVGLGPAGMFAALELLDHGIKPVIFERGKSIEERSLDVRRFIEERRLHPESNIQFGEGGAGSYSDGKLFSRRNRNTGYVSRVLDTFVRFGAPPEIAYMDKPHLGTDVLCRIVANIRAYILEMGGEIHFSSKMTDILLSEDKISGIRINGKKEYHSDTLFLAMGHSSRDTFEMLRERGVAMEPRSVTVGLRIEHSAETINLMRYGKKYKGYPGLGAATYSMNYTDRASKRGVYTFCMCPGGEVVNASSEEGGLVLNGMSYAARSSPFSNAALVVSCHVSDYPGKGPLAGLAFQREIEEKAFRAGGSDWKAAAQSLKNFSEKKTGDFLPENSFKMGVQAGDMHDIFPTFILDQLHAAFEKWKKEQPLFVSEGAILLAAETRTSSPVRILRKENVESVNVQGLFPIGEGSGHTGGITSSASDAICAVEAYAADKGRLPRRG
ncbi:hypothetical protein LZ24_01997 [Desulfobotulus alkaliphilus]|uniref:FAD-dependent protein C-terminal domain-containing protein n=1 Tax=Desulfobotulus alkaliphilus TaxID=622671 RepID=A0A562RQ38_9BACT|nr:dehydrogenase [Desulfobotulus alkaliphilus]TWI71199.1 hypothetical protein LZ24_01997 [Desulfobotulus alkaliphilus]